MNKHKWTVLVDGSAEPDTITAHTVSVNAAGALLFFVDGDLHAGYSADAWLRVVESK